MKRIVAAVLLAFFALEASAQADSRAPGVYTQETVTSTEVCIKLASNIPAIVSNKLGGKSKEEQIAFMEVRFKEMPVMRMFEPGLLKMIGALYDTPPGQAITTENAGEAIPPFLRATIIACVRAESIGWIQQVPGIVEFERADPADLPPPGPANPEPSQRFKTPKMGQGISI